jgi:hypothetical protein
LCIAKSISLQPANWPASSILIIAVAAMRPFLHTMLPHANLWLAPTLAVQLGRHVHSSLSFTQIIPIIAACLPVLLASAMWATAAILVLLLGWRFTTRCGQLTGFTHPFRYAVPAATATRITALQQHQQAVTTN